MAVPSQMAIRSSSWLITVRTVCAVFALCHCLTLHLCICVLHVPWCCMHKNPPPGMNKVHLILCISRFTMSVSLYSSENVRMCKNSSYHPQVPSFTSVCCSYFFAIFQLHEILPWQENICHFIKFSKNQMQSRLKCEMLKL